MVKESKDFHESRSYIEHLTCSRETKTLLMTACVDAYLKVHPEMQDVKLTHGFMLKKLVEFYLQDA